MSLVSCISSNMDIIRLSNKGRFTSHVDIYLEDLSNELANVFIIEPKSFTLNENDSIDITICAFPKALKLYVNKLIICVKDNPTPIVYPLMCIGKISSSSHKLNIYVTATDSLTNYLPKGIYLQ